MNIQELNEYTRRLEARLALDKVVLADSKGGRLEGAARDLVASTEQMLMQARARLDELRGEARSVDC